VKVISHRGYWLSANEKNTNAAFERSFKLGFGTETDIRDSLGRLVISHDVPSGSEQSLEEFLICACRFATSKNQLTLALNIKSDGLAAAIAEQLRCRPQFDCFVFDMAVPDMRHYFSVGIPVFTRMSEVEVTPSFFEQAAGIWLDSFDGEWYCNGVIEDILRAGKRVCIVSPELHGRPHIKHWGQLKNLKEMEGIIICTDKPEDALTYFKGPKA
jgi:hypothetical protein